MEQDSIPVGCIPSAAVAVGGGGVGCLPQCMLGYLSGGVCPSACWDTCLGGVCPVHAGIHIPPRWTEFLKHACENITFPQLLLRTVITCVKTVHTWLSHLHWLRSFDCSQLEDCWRFDRIRCWGRTPRGDRINERGNSCSDTINNLKMKQTSPWGSELQGDCWERDRLSQFNCIFY